MRVLHVAKKYPDILGGDAWYVDALVRAAEARGHDAFVVAPNCRELRREAHVRAVGPRAESRKLDRLGPYRLRLMRGLRRAVPDLLAWSSPDVVHAHSADLGYVISRAPGLKVPVVLTCHSLSFPTLPGWSAKSILEKWCLRNGRFRRVTAPHPGAVEALRALGLPSPMWIPAGVDASVFTPANRDGDETLRLLFVGRLEPEKGLDVLLDALAMTRPSVHVSIVGDGGERAALEARARSRGLGGRVSFEGIVSSREAVASRYREADAFVLPSRLEGLPLSLLEAWASGLPAIVSSAAPVAHIGADEAALLVPPRNPAALARAIETLAVDPGLRKQMGARGRSLVQERFGWDAVATQFLELYASLAGSVLPCE